MKKMISILLTVLMIVTAIPFAVNAELLADVPEGFTAVYDIDGLYGIRGNLAGKYILMADIDMTNDVAAGGDYDNGYGWAPIGENGSTPFSGTFDGNGHTITGLRCYNTKTTYVGLFGYVTGEVKNLTIANATLINNNNSEKYIGAVTGYISKGKISNVKVEDLVLSTNSSTSGSYYGYYGGIAGYSKYVT
ncbi:MAG: hypothetical protein PUG83_05865, partial [Clostridiaceae bacterium]|nr:hypothetical protein [Clostridiaceae bacterium]